MVYFIARTIELGGRRGGVEEDIDGPRPLVHLLKAEEVRTVANLVGKGEEKSGIWRGVGAILFDNGLDPSQVRVGEDVWESSQRGAYCERQVNLRTLCLPNLPSWYRRSKVLSSVDSVAEVFGVRTLRDGRVVRVCEARAS